MDIRRFFLGKLLGHERVESRVDLLVLAGECLGHDWNNFLLSRSDIRCHLLCGNWLLGGHIDLLLLELAQDGRVLRTLHASVLYVLIEDCLPVL